MLLDSRVSGTAGGGSGQVFDWTIANNLDRPFMVQTAKCICIFSRDNIVNRNGGVYAKPIPIPPNTHVVFEVNYFLIL